MRWVKAETDAPAPVQISLREAMGAAIRGRRMELGKKLRDVSAYGVSLGYISEVERGRKEVSSEVLTVIAQGIDLSVAELLRRAADELEAVR